MNALFHYSDTSMREGYHPMPEDVEQEEAALAERGRKSRELWNSHQLAVGYLKDTLAGATWVGIDDALADDPDGNFLVLKTLFPNDDLSVEVENSNTSVLRIDQSQAAAIEALLNLPADQKSMLRNAPAFHELSTRVGNLITGDYNLAHVSAGQITEALSGLDLSSIPPTDREIPVSQKLTFKTAEELRSIPREN